MKALGFVRNWNISLKLSLGIFALVTSAFLIFVSASAFQEMRRAETDAVREVGDKAKLLVETVDIVDRNLREQVTTLGRVFKSRLADDFSVDEARVVEVAGRKTPMLLNGGTEVNLNFGVPDQFTQLTGAYATVFVRQGEDFVRITTSHKKQDGERAIGTVLDRKHPGYEAMLQGRVYLGTASLFGGQYMTRYDPIRNAAGEVIGILYVGINFTDSMKTLSESIKAMQLGKSGAFYAISAKPGSDFGRAMIHAQREGELLAEVKDARGQAWVQTMLEQKNGNLRYVEPAVGAAGERERVVAFSYIRDWEMLVAGDAYIDEITAGAVSQRNRHALIGLLTVAVLAGLLALLVKRMVGRPLARAVAIAETVAGGDLSSHIEVHSQDDSGRMMGAMQRMNASLSAIVNQVRGGTSAIAAASAQVASDALDLSARTEQQASALEETASAMEELSTTVRQNTDSVQQASEVANHASQTANRGGEVVAQVVDRMSVIDASAKRITDIIGVIDGIAFQTNILALNAAVEAARAGEQGRGFAVVAAEVRALAQRSANAAKEIKGLIGESVEQVEAGARLAAEAGKTMQEVVGSVAQVNQLMQSVSTTMREQAAGIEQINQAIAEMDQVTQQNSAHVEQTAAAAQDMQQQAAQLAETVRFFRLDEPVPVAAVVGRIEAGRQPARSLADERKEWMAIPQAA